MDIKTREELTKIACKILDCNGYVHEGQVIDYDEALEMLVNALANKEQYIENLKNNEPFTYLDN